MRHFTSYLPACNSPRIVLFSCGERGRRCISALYSSGYDIVGVVLQDESPATATLCASIDTKVYRLDRTTRLSAQPVMAFLEDAAPDLIILVGTDRILPKWILAIARVAVLNLHAGRLPEYRGASVMQWQLINGETEGACTIHVVDEGIDTGPIIAQEVFPIGPDLTGGELFRQTLDIFPRLLLQVLAHITQGTARLTYQDDARATYYSRRYSEDNEIRWDTMPSTAVHNLVRALSGRALPPAFTYLLGSARVNVIRTSLYAGRVIGTAGRVLLILPEGALVMCADRAIIVSEAAPPLNRGQRLGRH